MHALTELHKSHLLPGFHDRDDEEQAIDIATTDLTKVSPNTQPFHTYTLKLFKKAQTSIKAIKSETLKGVTQDERQLRANIRAELAREVQDLSLTFRSAQKTYLQGMGPHFNFLLLIFNSIECTSKEGRKCI